jgi:ribonuclease-3
MPPGEEGNIAQYCETIGLRYKNNYLFTRALTHRSYANEHTDVLDDNERLEFLGDAVLDFLVGAWIYDHFPEMAEGQLTRLRSALVRTEQLAEFASTIGLGSVLLLGKGEEENGGRLRPALLCATFEALVGALYLDSGISAVQSFIEPMLIQASTQILRGRKERDPKSVLQEWAQAQGYAPPVYKVVSAVGPDHNRTYMIEVWIDDQLYGQGSGGSKRKATKTAAQTALDTLGVE